MSNAKTSISRRFLAALLSFVLVLGLLPTSTLTAFAATAEHPDAITVSVTDQDGKALVGVTVAYSVSSTANGDDYASGTVTTDANGCVEVLAKDKYVADDLTLSATAALTDYVYADGSGRIEGAAITSDTQDFVIQLRSTKIPGVTVAANSGLVYQKGTAQSLVTVAGINEQTDTVIYKIDGEDVAEPKRENAGTYAVEVTVQRDGYSDFVFSENVTIAKAEITDIVIAEVTAPYNEKDQNIVALTGKFLKDDDVHWYVNGSDTGSAEIPQAIAVGKYAVRLTVNRGDNYELFDKTVNSEIVLGNIDLGDLKITANELTYNGNDQEAITVNNQGDYTLQYRLSETDTWKEYDKAGNSVPMVKNAGDYTVYIKAVKDSYNDKEYPEFPLNVHVEKAEQSISFTKANPSTIALNEDASKNVYDFSAAGDNLSGKDIVYSLVDASGEDVAEIDATTGTLTLKNAGIVTVKALREGNNNYKEASAYSTVTIVASQNGLVAFTEASVNYILDENGVASTQKAEKKNKGDNGEISYSIDQTNIGLAVDTKTGNVTVTDWEKLRKALDGTQSIVVTVTASKSAGTVTEMGWEKQSWGGWLYKEVTREVYPASSASYTLTISYETAPDFATACIISNPDPATGWYNADNRAIVTSIDISKYSVSVDSVSDFGDKKEISKQGTGAHYVYLKDETTKRICRGIELNIKIDTVKPDAAKMKISYSESVMDKVLSAITFGYYNPSVTVTFTAEDETSGLNYLDWKYTRQDGASTANLAEESGTLTFVDGKAELTLTGSDVKQYRGNLSFTATDNAGNTSDLKTDTDHVIVVDTIAPTREVSYAAPKTELDGKKYFDGDVELTFTVTETNFYEEDFAVRVSKNGGAKERVYPTWEKSAEADNVFIGKYTLTGDGDYVVSAEYKDRSSNQMQEYQSDVLVIDTINPVIEFSYNEAKQETTIIVTEHNFRPEDIVATVTATDVNGNEVSSNDLNAELHSDKWAHDGDTHTFTTANYANGIYTIKFDYVDLAKRTGTLTTDAFNVDHDSPSAPKISYSKSLLDTVLGSISFGFYNPAVDVTFTSYDSFTGVDYFTWSYVKQTGASDVNIPAYGEKEEATVAAHQDSSDNSKYTATITLPLHEAEQLRGSIAATATDKYSNVSEKTTDSGKVIVVDTISPTMTVEYSPESNKVGTTLYYGNDKSGKAEITFKVTEANFFAEDVVVKVSRNGETAAAVSPSWTDVSADEHIGSYTLSGDGHYIVSVEYKDRSNNEMASYTSDMITIDTINPVINVAYQNNMKIDTLKDNDGNSRDYFDKTQTAVVTITEHNFNPKEVDFQIVGKDVAGEKRNVNDLISMSEWRSNGDAHVITITYSGDANYTFDVDYSDLAKNAAEDYATDHFTIDTVAPRVAGVSYSTSILETVLSNITFGFYNAKMTVTITAEDDTAGVHKFDYSYLTAAGVSSVNAQLLNQAIDEADIKYSNGGKTASMTFEIPKMVLGSDNQFNGTVEFDVIDRSGNIVEQSESKRIVVDNIAPTATVAYNTPVNEENGISYYDGDIHGTITINEANFYADDVSVLVSRDGGTAQALATSWSDSSVDTHVGTFTLTDDADYIVTINYRDKSGNTMTEYQSNQLTIDTKIEEPTYTINGVAKSGDNGGAYKDAANIGFSFEDQNFDTQTVKLIRTRFNETKDVTAEFVKVGLNDKGGSGSFDIAKKVDNDGIYVLTVTMKDKAGHSTESHVKFTINRFGSVYEYSDYLSSLIKDGGQYIAKNGDAAITDDLVITEYNADRIVRGSLKIVITRDGETIDTKFAANPEASDSTAVGSSGWYQYVYTISKDNFIEDGVYNITITSEDATGNTSTSVPDNSIDKNGDKILDVMTFTVDTTAPEIRNIVGLDKKIVNAQEQLVKYTIVDVGGLKQVEVVVNGQTVDTITDFGDDLNSFSGEFTLSESNDAQTVQIKVTDLAGNITDTASDDFNPGELYVFNDVITVSTNFFVRWYANTALFWGSIGGVVVVTAAIWILIAAKRKKKTEEK